MLHLEHLNLVVKDIPRALAFYQAAFPHWVIRGQGDTRWYGKTRHWLHLGDDYQYLTFNDQGEGENRDLKSHTLGLAHFAFVTTDLRGIVERLAKAGFADTAGKWSLHSRTHDEKRLNTYYFDPDGYEIEFVQYLSDVPAERNRYSESY
ncbi:MAG: VOC family protein [Pseudomonadota bacterium]